MKLSATGLLLVLALLAVLLVLVLDPFRWLASDAPAVGGGSAPATRNDPTAATAPEQAAGLGADLSQGETAHAGGEAQRPEVARAAKLRGRLLTRDGGEPLSGASLSAMLRSPDLESTELASATADAEGRFELRCASERIDQLDLHLGGEYHLSPSILALEGPQLPADGELGDIEVANVREVRVLLRSGDGQPIRGGTIVAGGTRSAPSDAQGRCELRWVPQAVTLLRAEAAGFVPTEVGLAGAPPDPIEIQLEVAARLEVQLVPPDGAEVEQFLVVLRCEYGVAAGPIRNQADQAAYVEAWTPVPEELAQEPPATVLAGRPSAGSVRFHALRVDMPIRLEVRASADDAVLHRTTLEPFRAGEERRIEVALE